MNFLVTGGAGFIGSTFVEELLKGTYTDFDLNPNKVLVFDLLTYAGRMENLRDFASDSRLIFIRGDIRKSEDVSNLLSEIDVVVNFAAESHVDNSIKNSNDFISTNILGAHNLLELTRKCSNARFIQVSTDEVYGSIKSGSWSEDSILKPSSPYSASKASADLLVLANHRTYGQDVLITRCSNNYGPKQHFEKLIPVIIKNVLNDTEIPVYGTGKNIREWINVRDHTRAVAFLIRYGKSGEIYNIGSDVELTNLDLIEKISKSLKCASPKIKFVQDRLGHDERYSLDFRKITELGFNPIINFEDGISQTCEWYKKNIELIK